MMAKEPMIVSAPEAERLKADTCLIGFGRSGSNSLRQFMDAHAAIDWRRDLRQLLYADASAYPARATPFSPHATCTIDVFEWYALGVFRYAMAEGEWEAIRYQIPGCTEDPRFRIDPVAAAERIRSAYPEMRVILLIREQVDWLAANYRAQVANLPGHQNRFVDYLACTEGLIHLEAGAYDRTLELYQGLFGTDRVHVVLSEALRHDPVATLDDFCRFLGLASLEEKRTLQRNAGPPPVLVWLHQALGRIPGEHRLAHWLSSRVRQREDGWSAFAWLGRNGSSGGIVTTDVREQLRDRYRDSNRSTAALCGLDLASYGYVV